MSGPLGQFLAEVGDDIADRLRRGRANVYFMHDVLTPENVRAVWDDVPVTQVPAVGDVVDLPHSGEYGTPARWQVTSVEPCGPAAFAVYCTDAQR